MKKRLFSVFAAVCFLLLFALPVSAERQYENCIENCKLYDPDGMFTDLQQQELSELIRQTSDDTDLYVGVYVMNGSGSEMSTYECDGFSDDKYGELFNPQYGVDTDGILLFLNMDMHDGSTSRYMHITTCGMGKLYFTDDPDNDRLNRMIDHIEELLPSGSENMEAAVTAFCQDVKSYQSKGAPRHAYSRDRYTGTYYYEKDGKLVSSNTLPLSYRINYGVGLVVGAVCAALTALISYAVIRSRYKFTKSVAASNYVSDNETQFYQRDDMFIRTHTTKTRIDTDRSGGGGGFGGGGSSHMSGGHSYGGGGRSF